MLKLIGEWNWCRYCGCWWIGDQWGCKAPGVAMHSATYGEVKEGSGG